MTGQWTPEDAQRLAGHIAARRYGRTVCEPHVMTPSGPFFIGTIGAEKWAAHQAAQRDLQSRVAQTAARFSD